jgi:hypothetical protein
MDNQELVYVIENLMLEHNRMTCLMEFLVNKLVDKDIITREEFGEFIANSEAFNMQIDNNYIPNPDTILQNLEMEE